MAAGDGGQAQELKPEDEQEAMLNRVVEKPRRERQRRLLKQGYDAPDVADAVRVYQAVPSADMDSRASTARPGSPATHFSLADAAMAPYFQTLHPVRLGAPGTRRRPRVADWYQRVCANGRSYAERRRRRLQTPTSLPTSANRGKPAWNKIQTILADLGVAA